MHPGVDQQQRTTGKKEGTKSHQGERERDRGSSNSRGKGDDSSRFVFLDSPNALSAATHFFSCWRLYSLLAKRVFRRHCERVPFFVVK